MTGIEISEDRESSLFIRMETGAFARIHTWSAFYRNITVYDKVDLPGFEFLINYPGLTKLLFLIF